MKTYEDGLNEAWEDGLNEAWELARYISCTPNEGGKSIKWVEDVFGCDNRRDVLRNHSASEVIAKIEEYENRIKVGDEVVNKYGWKRVVTNTHINGEVTLMDSNGDFYAYCRAEVNDLDLKKTGRHFSQIEEVLQQIKEEDKGE